MSRKSARTNWLASNSGRIERISPQGIVERTVVPWSIPGNERSSMYFEAPVTLAKPSLRGSFRPTAPRERADFEVAGFERRDLLVNFELRTGSFGLGSVRSRRGERL